jgi:hypothetical protein
MRLPALKRCRDIAAVCSSLRTTSPPSKAGGPYVFRLQRRLVPWGDVPVRGGLPAVSPLRPQCPALFSTESFLPLSSLLFDERRILLPGFPDDSRVGVKKLRLPGLPGNIPGILHGRKPHRTHTRCAGPDRRVHLIGLQLRLAAEACATRHCSSVRHRRRRCPF